MKTIITYSLFATLIYAPVIKAEDDAKSGDEGILACLNIVNDTERLACYDELASEIQTLVDSTTQNRIGVDEAFSESLTEAVIGEQTEGNTESVIISSSTDRFGYQTFVTEDGRRWKRSSGRRVSISDGTKVHFEEGSWGAIFMITEEGTRVKVKAL